MKFSKKITGLALALSVCGFAYADHWGYSGEGAPENWGELSPDFQACGLGQYQTPINIANAVDAKLPNLDIQYTKPAADVVNNGHSIQVNMKVQDQMFILDGKKFILQQFHFHDPSENHIDGKSYPIEAHFVHKDQNGALAVLGVMYEIGEKNDVIDAILSQVSRKENDPVDMSAPVDVMGLLPENVSYYRFSGSLTTPPCSEGVVWVVLKKPLTISAQQEQLMREALGQANNRPLQALNGRVIVGN